jgi:hypothetical protein
MKRRALVIAAVLGTAWVLVLAGQRTIRVATQANEEPVVVSAEEFSRIQPGMTYEDCVRVIGTEGSPFGSSGSPDVDADGTEWISYVWRNDEDSYVMVSFHHGEVERTRAFNLE